MVSTIEVDNLNTGYTLGMILTGIGVLKLVWQRLH
jgi:hypothetical protein